ncbi:hypothetical protein B296_00039757 [Ensete ventricosum]|uniref:Uncharacterized protein n=1 Tax=Ensete ventricosum TaxID=4639 RepID=A0A426YME8_ENSVE|nr:hypothetical protein B296_00039757 [Ensete ventricosum]
MGEALKGNSYLDIEGELRLVDERKRQLGAHNATKESEALAMKELGINRNKVTQLGAMESLHLRSPISLKFTGPACACRTIDSLIMGYVKGKLTCFFGDPETVADVVRSL